MKIFYLNFTLDPENTKLYDFIDSILEYESLFTIQTPEGELNQVFDHPVGTIYVDCSGGSNRLAGLLYDFLKERKDNYKFVVNGWFSSNTILIFGALNPKFIEFKRQSYACIHLSSYNVEVRELLFYDKAHHSSNFLNYFEEYNKDLLKIYKDFTSKQELKCIKNGGDVDINSMRLSDLFKSLRKNDILQKKFKKIFEITL